MKRGAQFAFGLSALLFCLFLLGITDFGQALLRGRIPPNATPTELDDIYMGAGLAPWVYCLAPSVALVLIGSALMATTKRLGKILGWLGLLCLAIFWLVRFVPETGDTIFGASILGKFTLFGIFIAAAVLPLIAGIRGSKWWFVIAAVSFATLVDSYLRFFSRVVR